MQIGKACGEKWNTMAFEVSISSVQPDSCVALGIYPVLLLAGVNWKCICETFPLHSIPFFRLWSGNVSHILLFLMNQFMKNCTYGSENLFIMFNLVHIQFKAHKLLPLLFFLKQWKNNFLWHPSLIEFFFVYLPSGRTNFLV